MTATYNELCTIRDLDPSGWEVEPTEDQQNEFYLWVIAAYSHVTLDEYLNSHWDSNYDVH